MVDPHLRHEIKGILVKIPPPPLDSQIAESALLRLRAVAFFVADKPTGDDVAAACYEPDTKRWSQPTRDELLGKGRDKELNKRLSHLTTRRLQRDFDWLELLDRIPPVVDKIEAFICALSPDWQPHFEPILDDIRTWRSTPP